MIDFHSHILPGIDDGSRSVEMSLQMLSAMQEQKIDTVIATSHFYATQRSPQRFLYRRQEAWERLYESLPEDAPKILLLEMPFDTWREAYIREVKELARSGDYTILMAHIERYYFKQPVSVWNDFLELGILMQSNADFFLPFRTRRKALKLLEEGRIHLLGTDAHNMQQRAPRMDEATAMIRKHLGSDVLRDINHLGRELLREGGL